MISSFDTSNTACFVQLAVGGSAQNCASDVLSWGPSLLQKVYESLFVQAVEVLQWRINLSWLLIFTTYK